METETRNENAVGFVKTQGVNINASATMPPESGDWPIAIILTGRAGSGKDTVANILQAQSTKSRVTQRISFADGVRDVTCALWAYFQDIWAEDCDRVSQLNPRICADPETKNLPLSVHSYYKDCCVHSRIFMTPGKEGTPLSARSLLQHIGTDIVRKHCGEDVWVRSALARVSDGGGNAVFTDARFPNEMRDVKAELQRRGWHVYVWRIVDPTQPNDAAAKASLHITETAADNEPADVTIFNAKADGLRALETTVLLHWNNAIQRAVNWYTFW